MTSKQKPAPPPAKSAPGRQHEAPDVAPKDVVPPGRRSDRSVADVADRSARENGG